MPNRKEGYAQTFTVPAASGSYAPERIAFGEVKAGMALESFMGLTVNVDTTVATMVTELWVRRFGASVPFLDSDYQYSGKAIGASGSETWALAGYPGMQIRVKSGGTAGSAILSATAF